MMRRFLLASVVVAFTFAFAFSDTQNVRIFKVDGQKITWKKVKGFDPDTKMPILEDKEVISTVTKDATFEKAASFGGGKKGKKAADPTPLEGGLTNETFTKIGEKGVNASITTTKDNGEGEVTKITVKGGKGGKKGA